MPLQIRANSTATQNILRLSQMQSIHLPDSIGVQAEVAAQRVEVADPYDATWTGQSNSGAIFQRATLWWLAFQSNNTGNDVVFGEEFD
ncbi:MAG: hypothetical protein WBW61_03000 [Rhodanobacteraceae bacterium]